VWYFTALLFLPLLQLGKKEKSSSFFIATIFCFPEKCLSKKVDLRGQKGSMQWKDAKDVLVKQKQLGEVP
jgi:hypothetical protein